MRWPWTRRRRPAPPPVNHTYRLADGDTVLFPGEHRRTADILAEEAAARRALEEPTIVPHRPLLTRGQRWRADGGQRPNPLERDTRQ